MRTFIVAAGIAAAALAAGCSSNDAPVEPSTTSESPAGHGSLAQCLTEQGVPAAPGPGGGPPPGVSEQTWNDAMRSCSSLAPGPAS